MYSLILVDDLNLRVLVLGTNSLIQFLNIWNELRNNLLKVLKRPCLKGFCKDSVVSISAGLADNVDSIINVEGLLFHKNSDKLWNDHCWMSVVDLDNCMVVQFVEVILALLLLS